MTTGPAPEHVTVEQALAELVEGIPEDADTITMADAVAAKLIAGGYRGVRGILDLCPIAVYLQARTGVRWEVSMYYMDDPDGNRYDTPPAIAAFIDRFDDTTAQRYPQLDETIQEDDDE